MNLAVLFVTGFILWAIISAETVAIARRSYLLLYLMALTGGLLWIPLVRIVANGSNEQALAYIFGASLGQAVGAWLCHKYIDWRQSK